MIRKTAYLSLFVILLSLKMAIGQQCPIIPLPNHFENGGDIFQLNESTSVVAKDVAFADEAQYLRTQILKLTGISVLDRPGAYTKIVLLKSNDKDLTKQGAYRLKMRGDEIQIMASNKTGAFYGVISLLQLIAKEKANHLAVSIPCWNITDSPNYSWRGFMLDESRHFFGKKIVKELLDQMAWLKLNRFHWHLTDAPGWRLQIKGYPLLTLVGGIGNDSDPNAPAQFYTQEDIREIVAYAKARHIEVIPEIDMPGHATAANRAYPEFSGGGTGKYADFTFNPGKDSTYQFLTNILREVSVLFPAGMIHLGGDEVSFGIKSWAKDKGVKELMERKDLNRLKEVEHYFFNRMTNSSFKFFDKVLAWDEAVDAGLPKENTIIFWWRHNKPEQLKKALDKGYDVVLCPRIPLYFDFIQKENDIQGRKWGGKFSSVEGVYHFSGSEYLKMSKDEEKNIIGFQANLWSEKIKTEKRLEFMTFPRITALAEATWTKPEHKNYQNFLLRLKAQLRLYDQENIYYFNPIHPKRTPEVVDQNLGLNIY